LVFDGVADLRLARGTELPWEYAELTEIRLRRRADGSTLVEVVLWEDRSSLTATCSGVDLGFTPATADA